MLKENDIMTNKVDLPSNWILSTVGEIYKIVGGGTPSTKIVNYWNGDIPWITSADIYGLKDIRPRKFITQKAIESSATNLVPAGSIIVVTRVGLGKIALADRSLCFSQDAQALIGDNDLINKDYALYYLSTVVQDFKHKSRGTTIEGVTKKQLSDLPFLLPPLSEQKRIVAKIEECFSFVKSAQKSIDNAKNSLDKMNQSIMYKAFRGKLVPQNSKDEPASILLDKLRRQKELRNEIKIKRKNNTSK